MSGMPWGGSEVLWARTARLLQLDGHEITANYKWWSYKAEPLEHLEQHGATIFYRDPPAKPFFKRIFSSNGSSKNWLESERPDAVLVTLGYHPDQILSPINAGNWAFPTVSIFSAQVTLFLFTVIDSMNTGSGTGKPSEFSLSPKRIS